MKRTHYINCIETLEYQSLLSSNGWTLYKREEESEDEIFEEYILVNQMRSIIRTSQNNVGDWKAMKVLDVKQKDDKSGNLEVFYALLEHEEPAFYKADFIFTNSNSLIVCINFWE